LALSDSCRVCEAPGERFHEGARPANPRLDDGTVYHYAVVWNEKWSTQDMPWDKVFEVNGHDAVTLVTCAGSWDGHEYSDRRAVRAERTYGPFPSEAG
jgi:hypothetical protein